MRGWDWQKAELRDGTLAFERPDGLERALRDGFFFVAQPAGMDLSAGDRFAEGFYLPERPDAPDPYRGYQRWAGERIGGEHQGYYRRDADQTEQFFLESSHWERVVPPALVEQAVAMRKFAVDILRSVLARLDLPRETWDEATGGALSSRGTYTLTFNHFRPEIRARGLNIHKDSGWVTVLRSLEPGLEVERDGAWHPIDPIPGTFIVNFGCAMEILTRSSRMPVAAVAHRVVEQSKAWRGGTRRPDRFSYALFVDSSLDEGVSPGLFRYQPEAGLLLEKSFGDFLEEILRNTYREDSTGLY
ncbi:2OG-Fe(II) oxygenase family protein [Streptomyces sp. 8N706]|uniref:2OG-Fe(II) oxygenase family protein n=1 Tax=Streptomyces sp. 8N706 TaxID=3457416 RepID=UPI003FD067F7